MKQPGVVAFVPLLLVSILQSSNSSVGAFGTVGHQIIANVAWKLLTPGTQTKVQTLLDPSSLFYTLFYYEPCDECTPLGAVSHWADAIRDSGSSAKHFINVQDANVVDCSVLDPSANFSTSTNCQLVLDRDCTTKDDCVVRAIVDVSTALLPHQRQLLFWREIFGNAPRENLMWLVHWIADAHQPLHCSRASDRGGNDITVAFLDYVHAPEPWFLGDIVRPLCSVFILGNLLCYRPPLDLHDVWDDGILAEILQRQPVGGNRAALEAEIKAAAFAFAQDNTTTACNDGSSLDCVLLWANESLEAALKYAYRNVDDGSEIRDGTELGIEYWDVAQVVVRQRMALAAHRLASTLEIVLA